MNFSTKDQDNDASPTSCANTKGGGGWWYRGCLVTNFNGHYFEPPTVDQSGIVWRQWKSDFSTLKETWLMIRPRSFEEN